MATAILYTANVVWAIYERSQGQSVSDQVFFAAIVMFVHFFRSRS
ncbi:MAG: hypothetical protein AAF975_00575 [Spirochaetota bacterium]